MNILIAISSGLIAGVVHVFSGPDHLAAVAPLAVQPSGSAWRAGARWGLGHSSGVLLVGLLSLVFRELLPIEWLSSWADRLVGLVLVGIGIWGIRQALRAQVHVHEHSHGGRRHAHFHAHQHGAEHRHENPPAHTHSHAAFAVGALHGLAGSSHFFGVLPALAFPSWSQALTYVGAYGIGTMLGMASFSSLVGMAAQRFALGGAGAYRMVFMMFSGAALAAGGYWLSV